MKIRLLALALTIGASAFSQSDTASIKELAEVQVKAINTKNSKVSNKIELDSANTFGFETPTFFGGMTSLNGQSDNGSPFGYSYFSLRGINQNRLNYTLNGVPLNEGEDHGVYTTNYTDLMSSLKSITINRGAGSSNNGTASYGGLINMESVDLLTTQGISIASTYGSFQSHRFTAGIGTGLTKSGLAFYARGSITGSEGYRDNSAGESSNMFFSGGLFRERFALKYTGFVGRTNNEMAWLPTPEGMDPRTNVLSTDERDLFQSTFNQLQLTFKTGITRTTISPYHTTITGGYNYYVDKDMYTLWLNGRNAGIYVTNNYSLGNFTTNNGVTANLYKRRHRGWAGDLGNESNADYDNFGQRYEFSAFSKTANRFGKLTLDYDLQVRSVKLDYETVGFSKNIYNHFFFNPKIGASYDLSSKTSVYTSFARTHREPTRTDVFGYNDHIDASNVNQLNVVKPERVHDLEVGVKYNSPVKVQLNVYVMNFRNEILSMNQFNELGIMLRRNVDRSYRHGLEYEVSVPLCPRFTLSHNGTLSKNRIVMPDGTELEPATTPSSMQNTTLVYTSKNERLSVDIVSSSVNRSFLETTNDPNFLLPKYRTFDMHATYNLNKSVQIAGTLVNLTNKNYAASGQVNVDGQNVTRAFFYSAGLNGYINLRVKL